MNVREWALPVYTILIQLATGALLGLWLVRAMIASKLEKNLKDEIVRIPTLIVFATILVAMIGAHFHLSRPYLSFLAVINLQHSWLSREILFTVLFFHLTGILLVLLWFVPGYPRLKDGLGWAAILSGFATIYCMARIYLLPTQIAWNSVETIFYYLGETLILGAVSLSAMLLMDLNFSIERNTSNLGVRFQIVRRALVRLAIVAGIAATVILVLNIYRIASLRTIEDKSAQASLSLLLGLYLPLLLMRFLFLILGTSWLALCLIRTLRRNKPINEVISSVYIANTFVIVAEILERFLFYATHVRIGL